jgi:hypothetical protein
MAMENRLHYCLTEFNGGTIKRSEILREKSSLLMRIILQYDDTLVQKFLSLYMT